MRSRTTVVTHKNARQNSVVMVQTYYVIDRSNYRITDRASLEPQPVGLAVSAEAWFAQVLRDRGCMVLNAAAENSATGWPSWSRP